jgi:hypothetical protein
MAYTQQGSKLVGTGYSSGTEGGQGYSVALSNDGTTLAIGSYADNSYAGATWVFTRSGTTWTQQGSKLVGTGATGAARQGLSIALSDDGNTLAIGGYNDDSGIGATWVFTRSGSTWTQQGSKIVGTSYTGTPYQGWSIALNSDGNTLAIGGVNDNSGIGATWIFTRSSSTWTQQGSKLIGTGATGAAGQGTSVSLNGDGNTLAIGGEGDNTSIGATWIFTRSSSTWTQQGSKLVGTGYTGSLVYQGTATALSTDGSTLAIGGYYDNSSLGATWVFTRSGSTWTQQGSKLVGANYTIGSTPLQGARVSLSGNGSILAIGGQGNNSGIGATWIFTRSGGTWTQQGGKLIGSGYSGTSYQGHVSLSRDGYTLAVGGFGDNSYVGATWVFGSTVKNFVLTNTGTSSGTIDSFTFNGPAKVGHTANLLSLGGSSAATGNVTGLGYTLGLGSNVSFTVDYNDIGAGAGTYYTSIVVGGSGGASQTITSNIIIN